MNSAVNFLYLHPSDCEWRAEIDCYSIHETELLCGHCSKFYILLSPSAIAEFSSPLERIRTRICTAYCSLMFTGLEFSTVFVCRPLLTENHFRKLGRFCKTWHQNLFSHNMFVFMYSIGTSTFSRVHKTGT
jgi:hypothetical protein